MAGKKKLLTKGEVKRDSKGRFIKGSVSNPWGGPKGPKALSRVIRNSVDPRDIVDIAMSIARGESSIQDMNGDWVAVPVATKDRLAAIDFLAKRGWGMPDLKDEGLDTIKPPRDLSRLSDAELEKFEALLEKTDTKALPAMAQPLADIDVEGLEDL